MNIRKLLLAAILLFAYKISVAQNEAGFQYVKRPKLVVGIVVDQMRHDYLIKFRNKFSEDGFKRLVKNGFVFSNANYNYVPTYTAPGHACIYTGTTPSYNGIISNEWYDRGLKKSIYCVSDSTVNAVGTTSVSGKMSPRNMFTSTITDELKLATNMKSKVIGVALKDRGSILPAGHSGNAAYWHDPYTNNFVTSNYYMKQLPSWVDDFNKRKLADSLTNQPWNTIIPIDQYTESTSDDNAYEGLFEGETKPVFPHDLPALKLKETEIIRSTPFGNTFTNYFAMAACRGEQLGKGNETDFLAVSYSSTDYVGHMYGINAIELEDTYIRFDRDLAELLKFLDEWTGNDYLLFLTSDHGAANNALYAHDHHLTGGKLQTKLLSDTLQAGLKRMFGTDSLVLNSGGTYIYLNRNYISKKNMNLEEIQNACVGIVTKFPGVAVAITGTELARGGSRSGIYSLIQNGFNQKRSPDVSIQLLPGWMDWFKSTGTTHGSGYVYDTHVPLIFFGRDIKAGSSSDAVTVCDIAPTISTLLQIEAPNGSSGVNLTRFFE